MIDVGLKGEGIIPLSEFRLDDSEGNSNRSWSKNTSVC